MLQSAATLTDLQNILPALDYVWSYVRGDKEEHGEDQIRRTWRNIQISK